MQYSFIDRHCAALDGTERSQPFGPGTVVWKVHGHMFAAYTTPGLGVSIKTSDVLGAKKLTARATLPHEALLTGAGWLVLPWGTSLDALRGMLTQSYLLVKDEWPITTCGAAERGLALRG